MYDNREMLFEQRMNDYNFLRELYRSGKIGGLDKYERELLEFCHNTDMPKYLKENVWDKPIVLDEDGKVDWCKTKFQSKYRPSNEYYPTMPQENPYEHIPQQQYYQQPQQPPQVNEQKFYYLYDDNGNLIAAIPQK